MKKHLVAAALGGGVGGLLDIVYATVLWGMILGSNPVAIPQSVAGGLLGKATFDGGWGTFFLGLALHFFIAFVMALVYVLASRRIPALTQSPIIFGIIYGALLFIVMNYIVVPLSAAGGRPLPHGMGFVRALFPHVAFVGPAIALFAARAARQPGA